MFRADRRKVAALTLRGKLALCDIIDALPKLPKGRAPAVVAVVDQALVAAGGVVPPVVPVRAGGVMKRMAMVLVAAVVAALCGCGLFGDDGVEVCYTHPKYGAVCVKLGGGKVHKLERPDLTAAEKAEVEAWLKEQQK